jgi:hypothetical protein
MNQKQKEYLDREIKRSLRWCRRLLSQKSMTLLEMEKHRLGSLWQVRDELRKLEK